ncbi:MAG: methyl-coenzyme M reductase family protein [Candidatus Methanomethylophilaceae archaeon]|jgi:putative methanogenesis marker protein 7|nr:methyl-coenzyme M reductase family protein [Candidatus Methanomethylophilaceae archaeon]NLF33707.1 methanogenesis marker 7 protein [Thermoplasmatales archaeon]
MFEVMMYDGGVYRSDELFEMIEDVGGVVLNKNRSAQMLIVTMSIPGEDKAAVKKLCEAIGGTVKSVPLAGTEIAVVGPTLGRHHMPHPICDIAEELRRYGAITVVMGLARGRGKATSQISMKEREIIEEYDAAIFMMGNFKSCIEAKTDIIKDIRTPLMLVTGPMPEGLEDTCEAIIPGVGRKTERMRLPPERTKLDEIADRMDEILREKRRTIEEDPLFVHPAEVKQLLEDYEPIDMSLRPAPIVLHLDGLRVKIPMKEHYEDLYNVEVYGRKLGEVASISESKINDSSTLIRIKTRSQVEDEDRQKKA